MRVMTAARHRDDLLSEEAASTVEFARLVEQGLREDITRLRTDLIEEESRLTALEEIRRHSMNDFEVLSEQGVTTTEAAMYYTLFHHLTREIAVQDCLVVNARRQVRDKHAAVQAASKDLRLAEHSRQPKANSRQSLPAASNGPWGIDRPTLKKAS